jgi:hypothetical protein
MTRTWVALAATLLAAAAATAAEKTDIKPLDKPFTVPAGAPSTTSVAPAVSPYNPTATTDVVKPACATCTSCAPVHCASPCNTCTAGTCHGCWLSLRDYFSYCPRHCHWGCCCGPVIPPLYAYFPPCKEGRCYTYPACAGGCLNRESHSCAGGCATGHGAVSAAPSSSCSGCAGASSIHTVGCTTPAADSGVSNCKTGHRFFSLPTGFGCGLFHGCP